MERIVTDSLSASLTMKSNQYLTCVCTVKGGMLWGDSPAHRATRIIVVAKSWQEIYEGAKAWCKQNFSDYNSIDAVNIAESQPGFITDAIETISSSWFPSGLKRSIITYSFKKLKPQ